MTTTPHKDCMDQDLKIGSKVLWSAHNSYAGFHQGVMEVVSSSAKRIRIRNLKTDRRSTVDPLSVICVDLILKGKAPSQVEATSDVASLVIEQIYGNCPVQAEGKIDGKSFYFRSRGSSWSLSVGGDLVSNPEWQYIEDYGEDEFSAGWMPEDEARDFIEKAAGLFLKSKFEEVVTA